MAGTRSARDARALSLANAYAAGDKRAGDLLLLENEGMIVSAVRRFGKRWMREHYEDLMQQARLGVLEAAKRFDWAVETGFWTYAIHWMRAHIQRWAVNNLYMVRFPVHRHDGGQRPQRHASLDDDETWIAARDYIREKLTADGEAESEAVAISREESCKLIADAALERLTHRKASILRWRFYVEPAATLEEIGQEYGCTREWIRQLEAQAIGEVKDFAKRIGAPVDKAPTFDDWIDRAALNLKHKRAA